MIHMLSDFFESLVSKERNKRLLESFINHLIQFFIYIPFLFDTSNSFLNSFGKRGNIFRAHIKCMDILHMIDMVGRGVQKMVSTLPCPTAKNLNPPSSPLIKLKYSPPPCADFLKFTRSLHVGEEGSVCHNRNTKT